MPVSTTSKLLYIIPPASGVRAYYEIYPDPITGERKRNFEHEEKGVVIENVRGKEETMTLDTTGFQFFKHTSKHTTFTNEEEIIREYYPESTELIKKLTGASRVELYGHVIRRRRPSQFDDTPSHRQPVAQVHVDQSTKSAIANVHRHLPASEVPKLLKRRFQIINLWRPIGNPALDWPLALCDYRSVDPKEDVFPVVVMLPGRDGEIMGVNYRESHKWKYLYGMTPEEIVLIKSFDSVLDGSVAVYAPHAAFNDPATPEGSPYRQSIELRALVFYD